jgi:hypothetical protein
MPKKDERKLEINGDLIFWHAKLGFIGNLFFWIQKEFKGDLNFPAYQ